MPAGSDAWWSRAGITGTAPGPIGSASEARWNGHNTKGDM